MMTENHLLVKSKHENSANFCFPYPHTVHLDNKLHSTPTFHTDGEHSKLVNQYKFADVSEAVKMSVDVENEFLPSQSEQKAHAGHAHLDQFQTNCDIDHNLMHFNSDCVHNVPVDTFSMLKADSGIGLITNYCTTNSLGGSSRLMYSSSKKMQLNDSVIPDGRFSIDKCDKLDSVRKKCLPKKRSIESEEQLAQANLTLRKSVFESSISTLQTSAVGNMLKHTIPKLSPFNHLTTESGMTLENTLDLTDPPYLCRFCLRGFLTELDRDSHELYHTTTTATSTTTTINKPYQCGMCEKTFKHETHLVQHVHTHTPNNTNTTGQQLHHNESDNECCSNKPMRKKNSKKPFKCFECGKSFTKESNLSQHVKTHSSHKPYSCDYCGKSFAKTICLKQHINTHTGEKPFKCRYCAAAFSHSGSLYHHEKGQHKHDGGKSNNAK